MREGAVGARQLSPGRELLERRHRLPGGGSGLDVAPGAYEKPRQQPERFSLLQQIAAPSMDCERLLQRLDPLLAHVGQEDLAGESLEKISPRRRRQAVGKPESASILRRGLAVRATPCSALGSLQCVPEYRVCVPRCLRMVREAGGIGCIGAEQRG